MGQVETKLFETVPPWQLENIHADTELDDESINILWDIWRKDARTEDGKADLHDWLKGMKPVGEEEIKEATTLFKLLDKDKDDDLEFDDTMLFIYSLDKELSEEQMLARSFRFYDRTKNHKITKQEMLETLLLIGKIEKPQPQEGESEKDAKFPPEVENLFSLMDFAHNDKISEEEFLRAAAHYRKLRQLLTIDYFEDHRGKMLNKLEVERKKPKKKQKEKKNEVKRQATI